MNEEKRDTMLSRERENIVNATIEANSNIDEEKALDVNNQIQVKKTNKIVEVLLITFMILMAMIATALITIAIHNFIGSPKEEPKEKENILQKEPKSLMVTYFEDRDIVKKFEGIDNFTVEGVTYDKMILLLSPESITNKYMLIYSNDDSNYTEYGEYEIRNKLLTLKSNKETIKEFTLKDETVVSNIELKIMDTEMKSYKYKTDIDTKLLMINATLNASYAMYIDNDTIVLDEFSETPNDITVGKYKFIKNMTNLSIDNYTLEYVN